MKKLLTDKQLELVVLVANGMRHDEIAKHCFRSLNTVKVTLKAAQISLGANTLPHLISIAIAEGLLEWREDENDRVITKPPVEQEITIEFDGPEKIALRQIAQLNAPCKSGRGSCVGYYDAARIAQSVLTKQNN